MNTENCDNCIYYDSENGGCPFVDGCEYAAKTPEGYIAIRE